jgi:hypothetical protein
MTTVSPQMLEWLKSLSQKSFQDMDMYTLGVIKKLMMMGYKVKVKENKQ